MMRRGTLAQLGWEAQVRAVNAVYSGYVVPLTFTEPQLETHVRCNDILLDQSPLWRDEEGDVAALALLAVRGDRGWIGGFGVAPGRRGQGLGRELAREMLAIARRAGVAHLQLEVLTQNLPAIRTYERVGFRRTRDLRILTRAADAAAPSGAATAAPDLTDVTAAALLEHDASARAHAPCWQRAAETLLQFEGLSGIALGEPSTPRAFAIYRARPEEVRIADLAARDPRDLVTIATALVARHPGRRFMIMNEPEASPVCAVLEALGFKESLRQHEMAVAIA